jgi:hypothetical protein
VGGTNLFSWSGQQTKSGLPDGLFSNQKSKFGQILEGPRKENAGKFYGHWEYFTAIWYNLRPLGNVVVNWYTFPRFGTLCQEKSGNPGQNVRNLRRVTRLGELSTIW